MKDMKMKNRNMRNRLVAILLCLTLSAGGAAAAVYAAGNDKTGEADKKDEILSSIVVKKEEAAVEKDETVYVLAGADGTVQKIIVSDWIKNHAGSATLSDSSSLKDVENVKGDESYTLSGDSMRVWDAQGRDIYCQGSSDQALPVDMAVSYTLDGKNVSAAELAGKSGKVTIRYTYTNRQYQIVELDGKQEKIYVPFVMLTGLLLDNDVFSNVTVSNGKVLNDGNRTVVAGIAFPGLQSDLAIERDTLEIPDYVEITADVTGFTMGNTVTLAVNGIFDQLNLDSLDSMSSMTGSLDALGEAMGALMDGSSQLYDGLQTLLDKSGELIAGIDALYDGATQLKSGAATLVSGTTQLASGASQLADGLHQLDANSAALNEGAAQVFRTLLATAQTQLSAAGLTVPELTIDNYKTVLNGVLDSLDEQAVSALAQKTASEKVREAVNEKKDLVQAQVSAAVEKEVGAKVQEAVRAGVTEKVLAAAKLTPADYEAGVKAGVISAEQQKQIAAAVDTQMASDAVKALIESNTAAQMASEEVQTLIASKTDEQIAKLIEENLASDEVKSQIAAAKAQAKAGRESIAALIGQLDSYNTFYTGLDAYTEGVSKAKDGAMSVSGGAVQLKNGSAALYSGIDTLCDGIFTLKNGAPALTDGVSQLADGAMQLRDGLREFNEQGVQKLIDALDGDVEGLLNRVRAIADVSSDYRSFSGLSDEMDGSVKFIYRTDSIGE